MLILSQLHFNHWSMSCLCHLTSEMRKADEGVTAPATNQILKRFATRAALGLERVVYPGNSAGGGMGSADRNPRFFICAIRVFCA